MLQIRSPKNHPTSGAWAPVLQPMDSPLLGRYRMNPPMKQVQHLQSFWEVSIVSASSMRQTHLANTAATFGQVIRSMPNMRLTAIVNSPFRREYNRVCYRKIHTACTGENRATTHSCEFQRSINRPVCYEPKETENGSEICSLTCSERR